MQAVITSSSSARLRWVGRGGLCLCCRWKGVFGFAGRPRMLSGVERHRMSGFMCHHCLTELSFCRTEPFSVMSSVTQNHCMFFNSVKHKRRTFEESTVHTVTRSFQKKKKKDISFCKTSLKPFVFHGRKSYGFGTTCGWGNDSRIYIVFSELAF